MANVSEWKRPSDIMKIQRRRKSVSQKRILPDNENRTTVIYKSPSKPVKRRNPFSVSETAENPSKRQNVGQSENGGKDCLLFDVLSMTETQCALQKQKSCISVEVEQGLQSQTVQKKLKPSVADSPQNEQPKNLPSIIVDKPKEEVFPYVPIDWSLKTKMRIVSNQSLQWCTQLKSTDEAQGISNFVTNQHMRVDNLIDQKMSFQRCCMYWEHPNIPWVRLFPRIIDDSKLSGSGSYLMQDDVQKSIQGDWEQSFTSVYHQLRSRLCPYFYLCTHLFTVMFHYHSGPQSDMVAMVSPTTRGFREALETEGIPFKLPVLNKIASPDKATTSSKENEGPEDDAEQSDSKKVGDVEEDDDLLETDDAASGWLESIGLDKKAFPSLDPRKVKIQREGFRVIDNRPESLVLVQGPDVQALFNFLLNCRTCTANSGPQAGIPPTILSASPFKGATLKCQKVKHSTVKHADKEGHISHAHILEVTGPILTSHSQAVTSLLHQTQTADFSIVYSNHDATTPFNILPKVLKEQCVQCGSTSCYGNGSCEVKVNSDRDRDILNLGKFYKDIQISDRLCAIKEVSCTPEGFTWNT